MATDAVFYFRNRKIFSVNGVHEAEKHQRVEVHQRAKFRQNRSIACKKIKHYSIFQDGDRYDLGFSNSQKFDGVWRAKTNHCGGFRQNRDIAIFPIFNWAAVAILDF